MDVNLAYGKGRLTVQLPSGIQIDTFAPAIAEQRVDYARFRSVMRESGGLEFLGGKAPLFAVNDGYRRTPTVQVLDWLDRIDGTLLDRSDFLIATGSHAAPKPEHYDTIFGSHFARIKDRVKVHVATDLDSMVVVGTDGAGENVYLNKQVLEHETVFVIGSVEPHYFAGYTGGRKSIFPGLIDLASIERNHNLANSLEAQPLRLAGNPVADELSSLMALLEPEKFFSVQIVLDARGNMADLFAGNLQDSFDRSVALAESIYSHRVSESYDAVLCELISPLDKNLYQAQKALENCQDAVADGGSAVVVSACEEGVGSQYFFEQASGWDRERNESVDGVQRFGSHKLSRVNAMTRRIDVRLHSGLDDDTVRRVFYEPLVDIGEYISRRAEQKKNYRLAVVHDAGHTVLRRQIT